MEADEEKIVEHAKKAIHFSTASYFFIWNSKLEHKFTTFALIKL